MKSDILPANIQKRGPEQWYVYEAKGAPGSQIACPVAPEGRKIVGTVPVCFTREISPALLSPYASVRMVGRVLDRIFPEQWQPHVEWRKMSRSLTEG